MKRMLTRNGLAVRVVTGLAVALLLAVATRNPIRRVGSYT